MQTLKHRVTSNPATLYSCPVLKANCRGSPASITNHIEITPEGCLPHLGDTAGGGLSLSPEALLDHAGVEYPADRYRETNPQTLYRREHSAQVMMTLLLAGVDVYTADVPQLHDCPRGPSAGYSGQAAET